nr:transmembrane protein [Candidatus Pantoea persica]
MKGNRPLHNPLQRFGAVSLSSSFLASCPMAVVSTMYVLRSHQQRLALAQPATALVRISHVGSYVCRNIYHRTEGRLSEHAWDVTGVQLADVGKNWTHPENKAALLHQPWQEGGIISAMLSALIITPRMPAIFTLACAAPAIAVKLDRRVKAPFNQKMIGRPGIYKSGQHGQL